MVSGSLSLPCEGFFSPFPHGTGSLSVSHEYLALPDGPGGFARDSSCPALLRHPRCIPANLRVSGFHALWPRFPARSASFAGSFLSGDPTTPAAPRRRRFGLLPFRSPLLGESFLFSPPAGTEMFQFPAFASRMSGMPALCRRVAPFGNPRVKGRLRLPAAFRSLPRPSSPVGA